MSTFLLKSNLDFKISGSNKIKVTALANTFDMKIYAIPNSGLYKESANSNKKCEWFFIINGHATKKNRLKKIFVAMLISLIPKIESAFLHALV